MRVSIKNFQISMNLGNNGIELDVYDKTDKHLGDLIIGKAKIVWCKGKTQKKNGIVVTWDELIDFFESQQ